MIANCHARMQNARICLQQLPLPSPSSEHLKLSSNYIIMSRPGNGYVGFFCGKRQSQVKNPPEHPPVTWTHRPVHTADCTRLVSSAACDVDHRPVHTADCGWLMSGATRDMDPPTRPTQPTVHGSCLVLPVTWTHRPVHTADCTRLMSGAARDMDPSTRPHSRLYTAHVWCYP